MGFRLDEALGRALRRVQSSSQVRGGQVGETTCDPSSSLRGLH